VVVVELVVEVVVVLARLVVVVVGGLVVDVVGFVVVVAAGFVVEVVVIGGFVVDVVVARGRVVDVVVVGRSVVEVDVVVAGGSVVVEFPTPASIAPRSGPAPYACFAQCTPAAGPYVTGASSVTVLAVTALTVRTTGPADV
jgi:hypothetical protein